jgi:hypothetical protein
MGPKSPEPEPTFMKPEPMLFGSNVHFITSHNLIESMQPEFFTFPARMNPAGNVASLVNKLGHGMAKEIIQAQVVYPRTSSLEKKTKAVIVKSYNSTLKHPIEQLRKEVELKVHDARHSYLSHLSCLQAIDALADAVQILELMEEFKGELLLEQVDRIVIYKGGFDVICLTNEAKPEQDSRSLYIEINSIRSRMVDTIQALRSASESTKVFHF